MVMGPFADLFDRFADREKMGEIMFRLMDGEWWTTQELVRITKLTRIHVYDTLKSYEKQGMVEKQITTVRPNRGKVIVGTHKLCLWRIKQN